MNFLKLLLLAGLIGGGWQYWNKHQETRTTAQATSTQGFVTLPAPSGSVPGQVLVIAAENCTADAARRADDLAHELASRKVRVTRTHNVNFQFDNPDAATMDRLNRVMNGELPIVFVGGRAKNNPSLADVLAELRG